VDLPFDLSASICGHNEQVMERRAYEVLDAAWDVGIRYFGAARSYGLGEQFLAAGWHRERFPLSP
jgi:aryl-alcohol dehydrogenase-like predicted oxidoreductase